MFIGHLPAGYVTARLLLQHVRLHGVATGSFVLASLAGAVAPDLDLLYFYLVDGRQHHHHAYVTHFPALWLALMLACAAWWCWGGTRSRALVAGVFSLGGFVHMLLDSIVGDIAWFAPFSAQRFSLFAVPALYKPWWLNFILHWSFALELALLAGAAVLWNCGTPPVKHSRSEPLRANDRYFRP
jgi:inner membrane protein